jgi:hypothetical protein
MTNDKHETLNRKRSAKPASNYSNCSNPSKKKWLRFAPKPKPNNELRYSTRETKNFVQVNNQNNAPARPWGARLALNNRSRNAHVERTALSPTLTYQQLTITCRQTFLKHERQSPDSCPLPPDSYLIWAFSSR